MRSVRWEALFADLEAQMTASEVFEVGSQAAAMTRAEFARTALPDRLRAQGGAAASLRLRDGRWVEGRVLDVAERWVLLAAPSGQDRADEEPSDRLLVVLGAVERLRALTPRSAPGAGVVATLGVGSALRALARDRAPVTVLLASGDLTGTIDRVGHDHLDLAVHPVDAPRRPSSVTEVATVALDALLAVRSSDR